jgi:hypothetical protein
LIHFAHKVDQGIKVSGFIDIVKLKGHAYKVGRATYQLIQDLILPAFDVALEKNVGSLSGQIL